MEPDWDVIPLPANKHKKSANRRTAKNGAGWRKKNSLVENFSTTGESLLVCKLATATHCKRYKPSDRSDLVLRLYATLMEPDWDVIPLPAIKHKKKRQLAHYKKLERAMGFEPTTSTLARLRSTPELYPHQNNVLLIIILKIKCKTFFYKIVIFFIYQKK